MAAVRCQIDTKDFKQAKEILTRLAKTWEKDPVFYLIAVIAQKQKDWDGMELAVQKAIRLNPTKVIYHYLFAKSLAKQNKYPQAESAVTTAIQNVKKGNPWYYNFRASTRWAQKKYAPAVSDWEKAFELKPDRSDFAYLMARGYQAMGQFDKALTSIRNALVLAPNNSKYKKFLKKIDTK
ncbi:MAG: tetratricopeptide repeat protein, partial [Desulfobacterales bacterium]|nr:tetratricopeptide repeat protein [Desulfobacterales bacterium]